MSWKVHGTDEVFAALRGLCSNSYRMYDPSEHRYYYDHDCDAYECAVEDAAEEYERLLRHCDHQREQLKAWGNASTLRKIMEDGMDNIEGASKVRAGSSITDELREFIDSLACHKDTRDMMRRIADRIDKEHAEAVADALQLRGEPDRWVELPVDAGGVPIHVGDRMAFEDGEEFEVKGFGGSRAERLFYLNESGRFCWGIAENCRHVNPDSWESIILDAVNVESLAHDVPQVIVDKLVERCRRLAGERE